MSTDTVGPSVHAVILTAMSRIDRSWAHRGRPQRLRVLLDAADQLRPVADDQLAFNLEVSRLRTKLKL